MTSDHSMPTRDAMRCSCGAALYETNDGRVFCEATDLFLPRPWDGMRHRQTCHKDDLGNWHCRDSCPIKQAQMELSL